MRNATVSEAKAQLSRLIESALRGEEVVITRAGKPVVRLTPFDTASQPRNLHQAYWRGNVRIADDFDAPLPEDVLSGFETDT